METSRPQRPAVLVTGASTGIGRSTALWLEARGWRVFAGVRKEKDAQALTTEASGHLTPLMLDVTEPDRVARAVQLIEHKVDGVGLAGLVNNAGIAVAGPLETLPIDDLRRQLDVNILGQVAVTQACLPLLRRARGRIVNMSSVSGRIALPFIGPYAASKFAIEALSDALRVEVAPWGIDVVLIEPGVIQTPIWEKSGEHTRQNMSKGGPTAQRLYGETLQAMGEAVERNAKRGVTAEWVARTVQKALESRRPRTRYTVGRGPLWQIPLFAMLPDRWCDWLLTQAMGLPGRGSRL